MSPNPRSRSSRAARITRSMAAGGKGSSTKTWHRDSRAALRLKLGFSVVAPIRVMVPRSMWGRKASCWARLNR